jgi:hypothetical protein
MKQSAGLERKKERVFWTFHVSKIQDLMMKANCNILKSI